jgi:hypothetical protein
MKMQSRRAGLVGAALVALVAPLLAGAGDDAPAAAPPADLAGTLSGVVVPSAEDVRAMVIAAHGLDRERFGRLARNAGLAALLPVLEVRVDRNIEDDRTASRSRSLSVSSSGVYLGPDDESYGLATDDDWRIRVRAVWELDRLVYDRGELAALQREIEAVEKRARLVDQALKLYFERRKLVEQSLLSPPTDAAVRAARELEIERLTARLDALTDGGFSQRLRVAGGGSP